MPIKILYVDTETTGVDPSKNGVWQVSGFVEIDGQYKEHFDFVFRPNPKLEWNEKAWEMCGKSKEEFAALKLDHNSAYSLFSNILNKHVDKFNKTDKFFICGYNAHFDDAMLRAWFDQNKDFYYGSYFWSSRIDAMTLATRKLLHHRHLMPNFQLTTVCKHLGIDVDDDKAHDGMYDIKLTWKLIRKLAGLPSPKIWK